MHTWRRRIAAMRMFHLIVTVGGLFTAISLIANVIQGARGQMSTALRVGFGAAAILLGIAIIVVVVRRIRFSRRLRSYLGAEVDARTIPALSDLRAEMARFGSLEPESIVFHRTVSPRRAPAEILRHKGRLHIVIRYELLAALLSRAGEAEPVIWHEFGHFVQWDTRLGYWSLRAVDFFGLITFWFAVVSLLVVVISSGAMAITRGVSRPLIVNVAMETASTAFLFGVFWFMRHWHRFCEFNADLTAAVAGYGTELIHFLNASPDVHTTRMKRLLGVHPSVPKRIGFILKSAKGALSCLADASAEGRRVRFRDYIMALLIHIAPLWIAFSLSAMFLLGLTVTILGPK